MPNKVHSSLLEGLPTVISSKHRDDLCAERGLAERRLAERLGANFDTIHTAAYPPFEWQDVGWHSDVRDRFSSVFSS